MISIRGPIERLECIEQRSDEREFRFRQRPDGREDRTSARVGLLTGMERASLSAAIREGCGAFLNPNKLAKHAALVDVLDLCSRVGMARANECRGIILSSLGLTVECKLYIGVSDEKGIFGVCC